MRKHSLSLIVPVYNEAENVEPLYREIVAALDDRCQDFELIFIDDGSPDRSLAVMKKLRQNDRRVKIISFRKNFGQSAAICAGFDYCRGEVVVTLDADLQNDPADIPLVVEKVLEGFDIVNGWRRKRKDKLITRRIPSFFGNKLISFITGVRLHDYGCSLRGFRREVVKNLKLYGEMHRYIPAIASRMGIKSVEVPVNHRERKFGRSKYGLGRTWKVILDLISIKYLLSYSHRPLQIFGSLGIVLIMSGVASGAVLTYEKLVQQQAIGGRPLLFLTILLIFLGFQIISLGLIAEMLSRIYHEGWNKNIYTVRETVGIDNEHNDDRPPTLL